MKITERMTTEIEKRIALHNSLLDNGKKDCGFVGDLSDIISNRPASKNNSKSKQGQTDCYIRVVKNNRNYYYKAEVKVNEGNAFVKEELKKNAFIVLATYDTEVLKKKVTKEQVIKLLTETVYHYTTVSDFLSTEFLHHHKDEKYGILYKSKKYQTYLDSLPIYENEIIIK